MNREPLDLPQLEETVSNSRSRPEPERERPGGLSVMGLLVSVLLFLCAAGGLFVLNTRGLDFPAGQDAFPGLQAGVVGEMSDAHFERLPINVPDEAFEKPEPMSPPPLPVETKPPAPKPAAVPVAAPARPPVHPKTPPKEIIERVPEPKAPAGAQWYSVRAGYSESRTRTDTLREVLAGQGFTEAKTVRDSDGLYYVRVAEFRFRHLAEETFNNLEDMGFEPTMHERTVAK